MESIAADGAVPADVRKVAEEELERIREGGAVDPSFQRVRAALKVAEDRGPDDAADDLDELATKALAQARADRAARIAANRRKREAAAEAARRSVHSFVLMWEDLEGWTDRYDPVEVGQELTDAQWTAFEKTFTASKEFVASARAAREHRPCDAMASA